MSIQTFPYNENGLNNRTCYSSPLFSIIISDHVLEGDEAIGYAHQGTLITKLYPDALEKIKKQYESGTDSDYYGIPCKRAPNGWYIADISQKQAVDELFAARGDAQIYVLDSVNEQCYLPRQTTFHQFTLDTSLVNTLNEAGLPNITAVVDSMLTNGNVPTQNSTIYFGPNKGAPTGPQAQWNNTRTMYFDASLSNPIYGNSDTVQPPSSLKLLYYKVGNTVVNESAIDIGNVVSELQLKMDSDHSNDSKPFITETYKNGNSLYRVWSDGWCEQGGIVWSPAKGDITIEFLKKYSVTPAINANFVYNNTNWTGQSNLRNINRNNFVYYNYSTADAIVWSACGYTI